MGIATIVIQAPSVNFAARMIASAEAVATAAKLGVTPRMIDATLNDAFGQRQVSTIYNPLNQYRVVMEAAPEFWQSPEALNNVYVSAPGGAQVPLAADDDVIKTFPPD